MHAALIEQGYENQLVGPISRNATAIEAREKPAPKKKVSSQSARGRPRKGEERPKEPSRLERRRTMDLEEMPKACAVGVRHNAKGYKQRWRGYKLPMDGADAGIPISCLVIVCLAARQAGGNAPDDEDGAAGAEFVHPDGQRLGHGGDPCPQPGSGACSDRGRSSAA